MNNAFPLVSVIIPCYNQGQYLDDAVNSVLDQTYQNFEIIIINDGSTELQTIEILAHYQKPKTTIIHTDNQGLPSARNNAIKIAQGKYILPLDADDKIEDLYLEKAINLLESDENIGIVYCEASFFGSRIGQWDLPEYKFPEILLQNVIFCSGFFRKSDWEKVNGYKSNMIYGWEDYDFWLSIISLGRTVYRIPSVLFYYRQRPDQMTKLLNQEKQRVLYSYTQIFQNNPGIYTKNIGYLFGEIINLREKLQATQSKLETTQFELKKQIDYYQIELQKAENNIFAMETSKFWKLRTLWFKVKEPAHKFVDFLSRRNSLLINVIKQFFRRTNHINSIVDFTEESLVDKPTLKHLVSVDIIICVHNALDDVKLCLESVIHNSTQPYLLIIVDDGSAKETSQYLENFANKEEAILLRNDMAKGYTFAANQGLRKSKSDYVILLNSDTIVTPNWLDQMVACGESDPKIGIVSPLSNTASWQSIPEIEYQGDWAENKLPEGMTISDMANILARYSARLYPRIAFLNGFCLMIKRALIEEIGYFDEDNFGEGYGEENDYCLRTRKAGWQLAIADDTYIYHSQSRSYSHERRKLLCDRANEVLVAKHGQKLIDEGVSLCRFDRVMQGIRARSKVMAIRQQCLESGKLRWEGKRILFILPVTEPGGGGNVVLQEASAMQDMGVEVRILNFERHRLAFEQSYPKNKIPVIYLETEDDISELLSQYDAAIATLYKSVNWLQSHCLTNNHLIRGYYIQDFEPYFFPENSHDFQIAWNSYTAYSDLVRVTKTEWNRQIVKEKIGVDCTVINPSINLDLYRPRKRKYNEWPDRPLRIAAMVRTHSPRRSPELTMEILRKIYKSHGSNIEIITFGTNSDNPDYQRLAQDFKDFKWNNMGILTQSQLAFLFNEIDIFVDFSTFQAMGLTAMEAMACGCAVIVPSQGGASSFAKNEQNSLIIDTSSSEACLAALDRLVKDKELRFHLQQQAIFDICQYFPEQSAYNFLDTLFA